MLVFSTLRTEILHNILLVLKLKHEKMICIEMINFCILEVTYPQILAGSMCVKIKQILMFPNTIL